MESSGGRFTNSLEFAVDIGTFTSTTCSICECSSCVSVTRGAGEVIVVSYADDFVVGFQHGDQARRFRHELALRVQQFGLDLPNKTRLFRFGKFAPSDRRDRGGDGKPETFEFLGFTHICGKLTSAKFLLHRHTSHTSKARMRAKRRALKDAIKRRQHLPVHAQGRWLQSVVRGCLAYHAVPTNIDPLGGFRTQVVRHWHKRFGVAVSGIARHGSG